MHDRLITDIGCPGIYSLSVKRQGFTDKYIKIQLVRKKAGFHGQAHQTTTCPQKGRVSRTSSFLNYTKKSKKKPNHHKWLKIVSAFTRCRKICNQSCRKSCKIIDFHASNHHFLLFVFFNYCDTFVISGVEERAVWAFFRAKNTVDTIMNNE